MYSKPFIYFLFFLFSYLFILFYFYFFFLKILYLPWKDSRCNSVQFWAWLNVHVTIFTKELEKLRIISKHPPPPPPLLPHPTPRRGSIRLQFHVIDYLDGRGRSIKSAISSNCSAPPSHSAHSVHSASSATSACRTGAIRQRRKVCVFQTIDRENHVKLVASLQ